MELLKAITLSDGKPIRRRSKPKVAVIVENGHLVKLLQWEDGSESPFVKGFGITNLDDLLANDWWPDNEK